MREPIAITFIICATVYAITYTIVSAVHDYYSKRHGLK